MFLANKGMMKRKPFQNTSLFFLVCFLFLWLWPQPSTPQEGRPPPEAFKSLLVEGDRHYRQGFYSRALENFLGCLDAARENWGAEAEIFCLKKIGLVYWNTGRMEESSARYRQALSLAQANRFLEEAEDCLVCLEIFDCYSKGKDYRALNQNEESIRSFHRAIELSQSQGSGEHELKCSRQLSLTYWNLFRLQDFHVYNKRALELARQLHHKREEGKCLINIGLYYQKIEDYSKALMHYQEALEIARHMEDRVDESACLNNIGILYRRIGNFSQSLEYLKRALSLDIKLENRVFISQDMNNIGTTFRLNSHATGDRELLEEALGFYFQSLRIARDSRDTKTEIEVLNNIGVVFSTLKDFDSALKYLHLAVSQTDEFPYAEARCMILNNIARVYLDMGVCGEAVKLYAQAIDLGLLIDRGYILWEAYYGLGQCYEREGQLDLAVECYTKSLTYVDRTRSRISLDAFKAGFSRDKIKVYESLVSLLYRSSLELDRFSATNTIFQIIERAKARAFLESLGGSRVDVFKRLAPELDEKERSLSSEISFCSQRLSEPGLSMEQKRTLKNRLQEAEQEYLRFLDRVRTENPGVFNLFSPEICQLERVQGDLLDSRTAIVEYFLGEERSYGLVITHTRAEVFCLPPRDHMRESIRAYLKILSDPPKGKFRGNLAAIRLYESLFTPVENVLPKSVENLILIPDGILHYLPFETLKTPIQSGSKKQDYLLHRFTISYAPSCSSLLFLTEGRNSESRQLRLLALGSPSWNALGSRMDSFSPASDVLENMYASQGFEFRPLPYSRRETKRVASFFTKENRSVYLKDEANEGIIKNLPLEDYEVIHFACHGFLDEQFPFRSALVLSRAREGEEDGFLQVREIYSLKMNAELIVLSACQTGKGRLEQGEGILGLPRIFFYTGAQSVLTSLWNINDKSTAKFMSLFYEHLFQGYDKARSLRRAKLKMIESRFSHPHYWAAFVLNGDFASPLTPKK